MVDLFADDDDDLFPPRVAPQISHQASLPESGHHRTSPQRPVAVSAHHWQPASGFVASAASQNEWQSASDLTVPGLTVEMVTQKARSITQAHAIVRASAVFHMRRASSDRVLATVRGSAHGVVYSVEMLGTEAEKLVVQCTCPDFVQRGGLCKHGAALLLVLVPGSGYVAPADPNNGGDYSMLHSPVKVKEENGNHPAGPPPLPPPAESPPHDDLGFTTVKLEKPKDELPEVEAPKLEFEAPNREMDFRLDGSETSLMPSIPARRRKLPASFFQAQVETSSVGEVPNSCDGNEIEPRIPKRARQSPKRRVVNDSRETSARAPSAYQLYLKATKSFGNAPGCVKWKDLSPEERRPYEEMAAEARVKIEAEKDVAQASQRYPDPRQKRLASCGLEERALPRQPFEFSSSTVPISTSNGTSCSSSTPANSGRQYPASVEDTSKHAVFPGTGPIGRSDTGPVSWSCPSCTFENSSLLPACEMCGTKRGRLDARPAQRPILSKSPPRVSLPTGAVTAPPFMERMTERTNKDATAAAGQTLTARFNQLMDSDSGDEAMSVPAALRVAAALDAHAPSSPQGHLPQSRVAQDISMSSVRAPMAGDPPQSVYDLRPQTQAPPRFVHDDDRVSRTAGFPSQSLQNGVSESRGNTPSPSIKQLEVPRLEPSVHAVTPSPSQPHHGRPTVSFFDRLKDLV